MDILTFIAENIPILLCFFVGIGLLILEAFMPGFGLPGISGIVFEVIAMVLTWQQHGALATLGVLLVVLSVVAIAISTSLRSAASGKLSQSRIIHRETESNEAGYRSAEDMNVFMDKVGVTSTVLRPAGIADFEGVRVNVVSEGSYVPAGTQVRVIKVEGGRILVRPV